MPESITRRLVVPIASPDDARVTAAALEHYEFGDVTASTSPRRPREREPEASPLSLREAVARRLGV